ncbi:MAG: transferase [Ancylobacter novellus]|uniref:Transferase n=1 Tax=Ancylobacter novellus TaxID=921 RepID=A0A2W5SPX8_ANCNO|nr:MAG: transferase [Ancylobacter novellus]
MLQAALMTTRSAPSVQGRDSVSLDLDAGRPLFTRRDAASVSQLMTQLLDLTRPGSDAEALRLLREAFPASPLAARVEAMTRRMR